MVNVSIFARFIPKTSFFNVLAIKDDVLLQVAFLVQQVILE